MGTAPRATSTVSWAVALWVAVTWVLVCNADNRTAVVTDSAGLAQSLRDPHVDTVAIQGTVRVDPRDFRTAAVISDGRDVSLQSASDEPAKRSTIDFSGTADVAYVAAFSALAARSLKLKGLAPPDARTGLSLHAASAALWPSVQGDPEATFEVTDTCLAFPLPPAFNSCALYCAGVAAVLGGHASKGSTANELVVEGPVSLRLPIGAYGTTVGHITLKVANSTLVCQQHSPVPEYGGAGFSGWRTGTMRSRLYFALMLGPQAALLAAVLVLTMAWWVAHVRRRRCEAQRQAERQHSADRLADAAIDAAVMADKRSHSTPNEQRDASNDSSETQEGPVLGLTSPFMQHMAGGSTGNLRTASELALRGGAASSGASDMLGDHHGYLLRMRLEGGLEGIELGPQLGRGSYGKVYKGRWKGALVAIKVVEHTSGGKADVIEGARESLLAASVSHPNVIPCYKICTVAITRRPGSTDAEGFPVSGSSGSGPERTASLVLPDSPTRSVASSGLPAANQSAFRRSWERPFEAGSPTAFGGGGHANAALLSSGGHGSASDHPLRKVSAEAPSAAAGDMPSAAPVDGVAMVSLDGGRGAPSAADSLPISVATAATSGRANSNDGTTTSSEGTIETWMLLEYADRGSLEEAIQNKRFQRKSDKSQLDMLSVYRTLLDIVSGMQYLHSLGLVHGDLKPANVLLKSTVTDSRGFSVKLTDFGLARMLDLNKSHVSTKSFGTIPYMPPELLSEGKMSRKADVFSFGIIAWQIFAGQGPHAGMAPMQVLFNVVDGGLRPDIPENCPPRYRSLVESCWAQRPDHRPTFDDLRRELSSMLEEERAVRAAAARRQIPGPQKQRSGPGGRQQGGSAAPQGRPQSPQEQPPQPDPQATPNDSISLDAEEAAPPAARARTAAAAAAAGGDGEAHLVDTGKLEAAAAERRASTAARRASESSAPARVSQSGPQHEPQSHEPRRPMPRPSLVYRRENSRSLSADDARHQRARDSIGRRVRITEPIERMRSTSEPSTSVELSRACAAAAQQQADNQEAQRRSQRLSASDAAAAAARLLHAPARLSGSSFDRRRASSDAAHSQTQATGSLATMSNSTATLSFAESEPEIWEPDDGGGDGGSPAGEGGSPAGRLPSSSLESSDELVGGSGDAAAADAAPAEPAPDDSEESRFVRLVKQTVDGGGPIRYSLEMGAGRHRGGAPRSRRSSIDADSREQAAEGEGLAASGSRRHSFDEVPADSTAPTAAGGGRASHSSDGSGCGARASIARQRASVEGAPPAAPSSGAAGLLTSPFTSTRSWRLREASAGSGSTSSSQDAHLEAVAAALAQAEHEGVAAPEAQQLLDRISPQSGAPEERGRASGLHTPETRPSGDQ